MSANISPENFFDNRMTWRVNPNDENEGHLLKDEAKNYKPKTMQGDLEQNRFPGIELAEGEWIRPGKLTQVKREIDKWNLRVELDVRRENLEEMRRLNVTTERKQFVFHLMPASFGSGFRHSTAGPIDNIRQRLVSGTFFSGFREFFGK